MTTSRSDNEINQVANLEDDPSNQTSTDPSQKNSIHSFELIVQKDKQQNIRLTNKNSSKYDVDTDDYEPEPGCCWVCTEKMRYVVITMGMFAVILNMMSRQVLNITLPLMTNTTKIDGGTKFDWVSSDKDKLLGSFFYTYAALQIPGGFLAERYGSKLILLSSVAVSGIFNLLTPVISNLDIAIPVLIGSRLITGAVQSALLPAMYALIGTWLTPSEGVMVASQLKTAFRIGGLISAFMPSIFSNWESVYYVTGSICMLWSILWFFLVTSRPQANNFVSLVELYKIARKKRNRSLIMAEMELRLKNVDDLEVITAKKINNQKSRSKFETWIIILSSSSMIGLVLSKLSVNFTSDFLTILTPTYIVELYGANKDKSTLINSLTAMGPIIASFPITWLVKYISIKRPFNLGTIASRRLFQGLTCFGSAFTMYMLTHSDNNLTFATIFLVLTSLFNMFACGGESLVPYDLSDEYPATIMAVANSVSTCSGFISPALKTKFVGDTTNDRDKWNLLILVIVGINIAGGIIFCLLVKAERINIDPKPNVDGSQESAQHDHKLPPIEVVCQDKMTSRKEDDVPELNDNSGDDVSCEKNQMEDHQHKKDSTIDGDTSQKVC